MTCADAPDVRFAAACYALADLGHLVPYEEEQAEINRRLSQAVRSVGEE